MSLAKPREVSYNEINIGMRWDRVKGKQYAIMVLFLSTYPSAIAYITKKGIELIDDNFKIEWLKKKRDNGEWINECFRITQVKGTVQYYKSRDVAWGYYRVAGDKPFKDGNLKKTQDLTKRKHWILWRKEKDHQY